MSERHDRFVRWQSRSLSQFTFTNKLVLGLSTAAVGLTANFLLTEKVLSSGGGYWLFVAAFGLNAASTLLGVGLACNRLLDFRKTMHVVKAQGDDSARLAELRRDSRELGDGSWRLLAAQSASFCLGVLAVIAFVILRS